MKILLTNINKKIKNKNILNDINLEISDNEFVMLIGKNGSGKSSLINIMSRFDKDFDGDIKYTFNNGDKIFLNKKRIKKKQLRLLREKVKVLFQISDIQLFKTTVIEEIKFGLRNIGYKGEELKNKSEELFDYLGFDQSYKYKSPFQLSEGEKRKLLIICIVSLEPELLILDEPTSSLDKENKISFIDFLLKLKNKKEMNIILITHDYSILDYSDKIFVMKNGELIFEGSNTNLSRDILVDAELVFNE